MPTFFFDNFKLYKMSEFAQAQTRALGNTIAQSSCTANKRSRKFFVTFWEKREFLFDDKIMQYACMCDDKCSDEHDGKWHGHYYVYYRNPRTWNQIKQYFGNDCHVEIPKINSAAIDYVMGRGKHANNKSNMIESGTMPCDNGKHISVKQALEMTHEQMLTLEDHRDVITIMKVKNLLDPGIDIDDWKKEVKITWIVGPSGVGKTETTKKILREEGRSKNVHIVKRDGDFWHGLGNGYNTAVYDDFRDSDVKAKEFIQFIDYNKQLHNVKNGSTWNNFDRIIITSVQHPEDIYRGMQDDEPRKQWLRRMEIIDLNPKTNDENDDELYNW